MMKGFVYAIAAAVVSFAAVTWATHMVTDQPSIAFANTGNESTATQDAAASLLQQRAEYERIISEQRQHIASLQSKLDHNKTANAENPVSSERVQENGGQERIISEQQQRIQTLESELNEAKNTKADITESAVEAHERAKLAATSADLWREVQRLDGIVAGYQEQFSGAAQHRATEVSRLQAEIDLRDQNIAALMRQLTATQLNTKRERSSLKYSSNQRQPLAAIPVKPVSLPIHDSAKTPATSSGAFSQTLEDGKQAYKAGRYETAFDIWLQLAEQGDSQAQFHVGALYFEGRGVEKDFEKSRAWLVRAQRNGEPRAEALLKQVTSKLVKNGTASKSKS